MDKFNDKLKQLRLERELPQNQVAEKLGITRAAYANYEQGIREPSYEILKRICLFFEVSADYLLGLED
ncbi:MAG: helix-turn-helix domain-containing protein [Clostridia bacterium]|nr:helix-turn-helix domain-containing protein [Clostridia bacterium]